jgi:MYXO-CTERM domain-containing protein
MDDVIISFDPDGEGTARGVLRFETNDPDEPWVDVRLIGEATYDDVGEYTDPDDCEGEACFEGGGWATTGCGCRAAGASGGAGWLAGALAALGVGLLWSRARRRRRG